MARNPRELLRKGITELEERIKAMTLRYSRAQARLDALLVEAMLSGKLGEAVYRRRQRQAAAAVIRSVESAAGEGKGLIRQAFRLGARAGERTGSPGTSGYGQVNKEALELLINNLQGRLGDAVTTVGRRADDALRREGLRVAAAQLADEESLPDATDTLVRRLTRGGVTAFQDRLGRQWSLETYAEMAIRTTTSEAIAQGTSAALLSQDFDVIVVNSVPDPCPICKPYDGNTYSLTGRSDHPVLDRLPPFHPNCRHFILPSVEAVTERREHRERVAA